MCNFKRPIIIDFSGKAGSGKTYVKNKLIENLSSNYKCIDLSSYILKPKDFLKLFFNTPKTFFASLFFVFICFPKGYKSLTSSMRMWFNIQIIIKKVGN